MDAQMERGEPSPPDGIDAVFESPDAVIALSFRGLIASGHTRVLREQPRDHSQLLPHGEDGVPDKSHLTFLELSSRITRLTDHSAFLRSLADLLFKTSGSHMQGYSTLYVWLEF